MHLGKHRLSEIFFFITGAGMLLSLPWVGTGHFALWSVLKAFYIFGLVFFIIETFKK